MDIWQPYVDTQLVATGAVQHALMCNAADGSIGGQTPDFFLRNYIAPVRNEDGNEVDEPINETANLIQLVNGTRPRQGLRINGEKYQILRTGADPIVIYAKKPRGGACIYKTAQCIIIATFNETQGQTAGGCNTAVERLGDYLRSIGY